MLLNYLACSRSLLLYQLGRSMTRNSHHVYYAVLLVHWTLWFFGFYLQLICISKFILLMVVKNCASFIDSPIMHFSLIYLMCANAQASRDADFHMSEKYYYTCVYPIWRVLTFSCRTTPHSASFLIMRCLLFSSRSQSLLDCTT